MTPVQITARIEGQIAMPSQPIALDGLLAAMVALKLELIRPATEAEVVPIDIPIEREPGGRFHLCSSSVATAEDTDDKRWVNRRPVVAEAQALGRREGKGAIKRIQINGGPSKGYRTPLETGHLIDDELVWYAEATAPDELAALLKLCTHLGKRRGVGLGRVVEWSVGSCERWSGFPVLWEGKPLRPLPLDWPGLEPGGAQVSRRRLTFPYWMGRKEILACPSRVL